MEESLQHSEIETFVLEREGQVAFKGRGRAVARCQQFPAALAVDPVALGGSSKLPRPRDLQVVCIDQRGIAYWRSTLRKP
ncbi:hypothetical protein [Halorhodospira sp. 9622]|uniref:hypothetical protein n=1 Tax=Halorhodospira sp. 9622 TaxID=2899136 RepID=UPI001EE82E0A|nr:hypothetical protein [Halorhodospira sp. 9622]MCG5539194.1 hypothetical protein [Halorhodospira sp. 9622]